MAVSRQYNNVRLGSLKGGEFWAINNIFPWKSLLYGVGYTVSKTSLEESE
jgi:hypothetical protein